MSRCFPYPPPGYVKDGSSGEALIESIKLQREKDKAKAERRKEKKKARKKEKAFRTCHGKEKEVNDSCHLKGSVGSIAGKKSVEDEVEQLEKSNITEDHEQPRCLQNPCLSSDSSHGTHDSQKRKRQASPPNSCSQNFGKSIVRIRLPMPAHDDSVKVQVCSTSGRTESPVQQTAKQSFASTTTSKRTTLGQCFIATTEKQLCSLTSVNTVFSVRDDTKAASVSTSSENEIQIEPPYISQIENWAPGQTDVAGANNQEWLFETTGHDRNGVKRSKAGNDSFCCGGTMLWPRARHMPEADIYALPFTVPF